MNLKHGDIITLDNGDTVKVSLEVIAKKVKELVVGKFYMLKHNGQFCHTKPSISDEVLEGREWQFIGTIPIDGVTSDTRYIFYSRSGAYSMWGTRSLDFVVKETN